MWVFIDGKASGAWTKTNDRCMRLPKTTTPREGVTLSEAAARAAGEQVFARERRKLMLFCAFLVVLGVVAAVFPGVEGPSWVGVLTVAVVGGFLTAVFLWAIAAREARWRRRFARDEGRRPAAGAAVAFGDDGVKLAGAAFAWSELTPTGLFLHECGGENETAYEIERIEAAAGERSILFDPSYYSNGPALLRAAYLKLVRERIGLPQG